MSKTKLIDIIEEYVDKELFLWDSDCMVLNKAFTIFSNGFYFYEITPCYYNNRKAYKCVLNSDLRRHVLPNVRDRIIKEYGRDYVIIYESELNKTMVHSDYYKFMKRKIRAYRKTIQT